MNTLIENSRWVCSAELYSGHSNPAWEIDEVTAGELINIWASLNGSDKDAERDSRLGYKGCLLRSPSNEEWFTYEGVVTLYKKGEPAESRLDPSRKFEKKVLANIPGGSMPEGFSDY
jgi:hypothetical protein